MNEGEFIVCSVERSDGLFHGGLCCWDMCEFLGKHRCQSVTIECGTHDDHCI
jgi:hypothetical protein